MKNRRIKRKADHKVKHQVSHNFLTIRAKLIVCFFVPIAFIIFLGAVSFNTASEGIRSSYEKSTRQAIEMTGKYISMGVDSVEAASDQYLNDNIMNKYFLGTYDYDISLKTKNFKNIKNDILEKEAADDFISHISVLSDSEQSATTLTSIISKICGGYFETTNGAVIKGTAKILWLGQDDYLDSRLGVGPEKYALRLVRSYTGEDSLIVIDMDRKSVTDILQSMNFDQTGSLAFVTADGKEITDSGTGQASEAIFCDKDFYSKAVSSDKESDAFNVEFQGKSSLFMYSRIGDTGAMVCAVIPQSTILKQVEKIKHVTVLIVIIACIIAVMIGLFISYGIDRTIKDIIGKLKQAAAGDLTVDFTTRRKDEFRLLINEINNTFSNMKRLIGQVKESSEEVSRASGNVSSTSELFLKATSDISSAMNEIEQGVNTQAKEAEECLNQMDSLSGKIEKMSYSAGEIGKIAEGTKKSILAGTAATQELTSQTKQTISITTEIVKGIEELAEKSMSISSITNVINDISNQTNLLSLNASIEAARAGEVGMGFAVVAGEIRSLAEQTKRSVDDIKNIIDNIQDTTRNVVKTAKGAENVIVLQDNAVKNTAESYRGINESVDRLTDYLRQIIENVENMEGTRANTLGAIENISAVLEEIAALSNNVSQISGNQLRSVESLNQSAGCLKEDSQQLVGAIERFIV